MQSETRQDIRPDLAVIIPYYEGLQFIQPCIKSVLEGTLAPARIYVVDNDPVGLTDAFVQSNDGITVIRSKIGIGFGRAVNAGIARALQDGYALFFVLNQDTLLDSGCLKGLLTYYQSSGPLTMAVPMMRGYDSMELRGTFSKFIVGKQTTYFQDMEQNQVERAYPITRVGTAAFLFGKDTWDTVGLFDPVFHMYGEDDDLLKRFIQCGGKLYLVTDAYAHHYHSLSGAEGKKKKRIQRWYDQSRMLLRIRDTDLSRSSYFIRAWYFFFKSGLSRIDHLADIPTILSKWKDLKSPSPEAVRKRIEKSLLQDMQ